MTDITRYAFLKVEELDVDTVQEIVKILSKSGTFNEEEITTLFFNLSKLLNTNDIELKNAVFIALRQLGRSNENAFMLVSSLLQMLSDDRSIIRSMAARTLSVVIDESTIPAIQRQIQQLFNDPYPVAQQSAILVGLRCCEKSVEIVSRWQDVIEQLLKTTTDSNAAYLAFSLYLELCQDNLNRLEKAINFRTEIQGDALLDLTLLRAFHRARLNGAVFSDRLRKFLLSLAGSTDSHYIRLEVVKTFIEVPNATDKNYGDAMNVLAELVKNKQSAVRYSALKYIAEIAKYRPELTIGKISQLEDQLMSSIKKIRIYGLIVLLYTKPNSVLGKWKASEILLEANVCDQIEILTAVKAVAKQIPSLKSSLLNFIGRPFQSGKASNEYMRATFDLIVEITKDATDAVRYNALTIISNLFECSQEPELMVEIIEQYVQQIPLCKDDVGSDSKLKWLVQVYRCLILETPVVRAAAADGLARIGDECPSLKDECLSLLQRSFADESCEVKDRCLIGTAALELEKTHVSEPPLTGMDYDELFNSVRNFYGSDSTEGLFDIDNVELIVNTSEVIEEMEEVIEEMEKVGIESSVEVDPSVFNVVGEGEIKVVGPSIELTEENSEYLVTCKKLLVNHYSVFEFTIQNTMPDYLLVNVNVDLRGDLEMLAQIPTPKIGPESSGISYVIFDLENCSPLSLIEHEPFEIMLSFTSYIVDTLTHEIDGEGLEDEFEISTDSLVFDLPDFMAPMFIDSVDFEQRTNNLNNHSESFGIKGKSLKKVVNEVVDIFGMTPITDSPEIRGSTQHRMKLAGIYTGCTEEIPVYLELTFEKESKIIRTGVSVFSEDNELCEQLVNLLS
eukprot:TRINITY_DN2987_c0_g1_i1.p1 TRINITY_DN2987_c0_g1~~TRINITY_DN2987_c0_g1_i1.p1  ORF type:complete len:855 (-),score=279.31 TRINITY_DN2987_c0_g1_i1:55-2595(-)